jgi:hypothetical protein
MSSPVLYALSTQGDLEPVLVKRSQQVTRSSPNGEQYPDTVLTVENSSRREIVDCSYRFVYVPFTPEIEEELASAKTQSHG